MCSPKTGARLTGVPGDLAEIKRCARHQGCSDAGLFHHAEQGVLGGAIRRLRDSLARYGARGPDDVVFAEDPPDLSEHSGLKPRPEGLR